MPEDQRPYLCKSLNHPSHKHNCQRHRPCSLLTYTVYNDPTRLGILLANSYEHEQKMAALQYMLDSVLQ